MNKDKETYTYYVCLFRSDKDYYKKFRKILKAINSIFLKRIKFENYGASYLNDDKIIYKISQRPFYWVDIEKDIAFLEKITRIDNIMIFRQNMYKKEIVKKDKITSC